MASQPAAAAAAEIPITTEIPSTSDGSSSTGSAESQQLKSLKSKVLKLVDKGNWHDVLDIYKRNEQDIQTVSITAIEGSVLHLAIIREKSEIAKKLLLDVADLIRVGRMVDGRGNNLLHLVACLGQADICNVIVEKDPELIHSRNKYGETPLFLAALHGKKGVFYALLPKYLEYSRGKNDDFLRYYYTRRSDRNTILHVTILEEQFELALKIIELYPKLTTVKNRIGRTPFHILATNASAFKSVCRLGLLDSFIYPCLRDEKPGLKKERSSEESTVQQNRICEETTIDVPDVPENNLPFLLNYGTFFSFLQFLLEQLLVVFGLGSNITRLKELKQKHLLSKILTRELVEKEISYAKDQDHQDAAGSKPTNDPQSFVEELRQKEKKGKEKSSTKDSDSEGTSTGKKKDKDITLLQQQGKESLKHEDTGSVDFRQSYAKGRTTFHISAMMGVTEIVEMFLYMYPEAINDEDEEGKNALLLAAEYKQPIVYDMFLKRFKCGFLFEKDDNEGNDVRHLAARFRGRQSWKAFGVALQIQGELKWYKFIMDHSHHRGLNFKGRTPDQIFIDNHKDMKQEAEKWLTNTSKACLAVVTIVATVAFALVTDLHGEKNNLDMQQHAFTFLVVSICSSVASLAMFLSISTSNFEMMDFLYIVPLRLITGLTLLFLSASTMLVSFYISYFLAVEHQPKIATLSIYAIVIVPITIFAMALFPLYIGVIRSTLTKLPKRRNETITLY